MTHGLALEQRVLVHGIGAGRIRQLTSTWDGVRLTEDGTPDDGIVHVTVVLDDKAVVVVGLDQLVSLPEDLADPAAVSSWLAS